MVDLTKVAQRREEAIKKAVLSSDWKKVDNLLNQPYENSCRKDRFYGLCSLDNRSGDTGSLLDTIADYNDPLSLSIKKEEIAIIKDAIERLLSDRDKKILFGVVFENKSFSHLAKEIWMIRMLIAVEIVDIEKAIVYGGYRNQLSLTAKVIEVVELQWHILGLHLRIF